MGNGGGGGEQWNRKFETRQSTVPATPVTAMDNLRGISVTQSQSMKILGEAVTNIFKNVGHVPKGKAEIKGVNAQLTSKDLAEFKDCQSESQTKL